MELSVWIRAITALALVALLLYGMFWALRLLSQGRMLTLGRSRLAVVVESTFLSQNTAVHVVKVARRYYLVGASHGHVALITELPAEEVEPYVEAQRQAVALQSQRITALFKRRK
ncbi:MAG TPA: flagellar biosynthetic protein FliO [Candidatus Acidoferrales bacterium]|nr:flagellar biosynthetic protein FliO [Candidatus Acidoferrales bacterium]